MALTQINSNAIQAGVVGPKIANVQIANSSWSIIDDTAVDTAGGYVLINGSGFVSGCSVMIGTTPAVSVSRVSAEQLRVQVPSQAAGTYVAYVINPDGGTAINVNALTYSASPAWVTTSPLDNGVVDSAYTISLNATGATSYSVQAGSTLPTGLTLAANGLLSGMVTGISVETQYTFTVVATDNENQDSPRTFSVTITVGPPPGALYAWGGSENGSLPLSIANFTSRSSPIQVGSAVDWTVVSMSQQSGAAIKSNGTLWMWGRNNQGNLGLNDAINRSSPVQVGAATNWKTVAVGYGHTIALKTDKTLWGWGQGGYGAHGGNTTSDYSSPVQVGSVNTWASIHARGTSSAAIKDDGTLWVWGNNTDGQLGLNNAASISSPAQLGSGTNWSMISGMSYTTHAIKTDGTLWAWGKTNAGQLGLGQVSDTLKRSSPVQVGTSTDWDSVSGGASHVMAIKTDGTLWGWGAANDGALGLGNQIARSSPTQIGSSTDWEKIHVPYYHNMAIKTDGTLWVWGEASSGRLGLNSETDRYSPVQLGSDTTWVALSGGELVGLAIKEV